MSCNADDVGAELSEYKHVVLADISRSPLCCHVRRLPIRAALCYHSNETTASIPNPPNSAQLGGNPYHFSKLHPGPCSSVGICGDGQRSDRHTQTHRRAWPLYILRRLRLTRNVTNGTESILVISYWQSGKKFLIKRLDDLDLKGKSFGI